MILSELCQELKNWFCDAEKDIHTGTYEISGETILLPFLQEGQYFRICGSVFNDGVHKYDENLKLTDEIFTGSIWAMRIPPSFLELANEIDTWIQKNGEIATSPLQSESWGGYSYSMKAGAGDTGAVSWKSVFGSSLNRWRKL